MKKVYFRTLGCKVNQYETEAMEELFVKRGYQIAEDIDSCDVYVVNTCTVTHVSDAKSRQQLNRVKKRNPKAVVAVVGCYAQVASDEMKALDHVDVILGTKARSKLVDFVEEVMRTGKRQIHVTDLDLDRDYDSLSIQSEFNNTRAYVKIQEGCDMYCSYCIIPYARGHIASRPLSSILDEVAKLAKRAFQEIVLTGIHVASYGRDLHEDIDLVDVCEQVSAIEGVKRIRLSSMEPRFIRKDRLERLSKLKTFCDHFHLSLQSGSDKILKKMNRKYDKELFQEKVNLIRSYFPDCAITTDVIVGFPGETEEDFLETMDFCKQIAFSRIHVFPFSPREGTPAYDFLDQVDAKIKKDRSNRLIALAEVLQKDFLQSQLGKTKEVLFEEYSKDSQYLYGYTTNYIRVKTAYDKEKINQIKDFVLESMANDLAVGEVER